MSDSKVISASVDEWIAEAIDGHPNVDNKSALVQKLLENWLESGQDSEIAALRIRKERLKDRKRELEAELKSLTAEIEQVETAISAKRNEERKRLDERIQELADIPARPNHPEIESLAEEHDKDPSEVAQQLAETHGKELRGFQ